VTIKVEAGKDSSTKDLAEKIWQELLEKFETAASSMGVRV
jgi:hypothetical protein